MKEVKINEAIFTHRKNLGNYEHEEVTLSVTPTEKSKQTIQEILADLKSEVLSFINGVQPEAQVLEQTASEEKPKKTKKAPKKEAPKQEEENEEENIEESSEEDDKKSVEEEVVEEEAEEEVVEKKTAAKSSKSFKKVTVYDRGNDLHKKLIGDLLNKEVPNWKAQASSAKEASVALHGTPFLDQEGEILPEFTKSFVTKMKKKK